jgi:hypothetical protein
VGDDDGVVDYVSFMVKDATGSIRVKAQGDVARKLAESERLPKRGMSIDVSGSLNVAQGKKPEMRLQASRQLLIGEAKK